MTDPGLVLDRLQRETIEWEEQDNVRFTRQYTAPALVRLIGPPSAGGSVLSSSSSATELSSSSAGGSVESSSSSPGGVNVEVSTPSSRDRASS